MPQDKRLIVTKAVLHKLQRVCHNDTDEAAQEGVFIEFVVPAIILTQNPALQGSHLFHLPHKVYVQNGRTTCLIAPKAISYDCGKVNKRHGYYDAVVTAEAICKRGDAEAATRAVRVANTFSHFVVDSRIVGKLPTCVLDAVKQQPSSGASTGASTSTTNHGSAATSSSAGCPVKCLTALEGLDERESLSFRLSQGATAGGIHAKRNGQLLFRIGHGGMTAGMICENAKTFVFAMKKDFPTVWRYIQEFKLTSNKTDSIRFMEVHIQR